MTETKMLAVLGLLGGGKTTLIKALLSEGLLSGRVLLVVNDVGEINVDATRLENLGELRPLTAGCIGCSDLSTFITVMEEAKDLGIEHLIVEPTGIADGREIESAASAAHVSFTALALVDLQHFERNKALGMLETQLQVADMVAFTWYEEKFGANTAPTDPRLDEVVAFCGRHAPGRPMLMAPKEGASQHALLVELTDVYSQKKELSASARPKCCNHHHEDHHHHNHGVTAESGELPERYTREELVELMASLREDLIRAKGVVAGVEFDFTQGTLRWGDESTAPAHGTFIATRPPGIFSAQELETNKKRLMRGYEAPVKATEAAILWQLGEYPSVLSPAGLLRVDCEADIARQLCERPGVSPPLRAKAIQRYCAWRIEALRELNAHRRELQEHPDFCFWQRRLGCVLVWHAVHCEEALGKNMVSALLVEQAPRHALEGLLGLTGFSFLEEKAEERPDLVLDVLLFGLDRKVIDIVEAKAVLEHCLKLSEQNNEWHRRWKSEQLRLAHYN